MDIDGNGFSFAQLERRAKEISVIAPGCGGICTKGRFARLHHKLDTASRVSGQ
jgi:hypothetical protein